ncbi:MAG: Mrp/NBP35 family ATP-binding protein [Planctomycetota bacterium]|nr:Mrp/NBP35 family ATP-binding protein [Planctomycetota bacterium]
MSAPTKDQVLDALRNVIDPDLHKDIVTLGFVTKAEVAANGDIDVVINLTTPACPVKDQLKAEAVRHVEAIPGAGKVTIEMTAEVRGNQGPAKTLGANVKHIVAVSSGKGGVGKSTVAVNLACALARTGAKVGLLDCDIYGPDIPMMMGLSGHPEHGGSPDKPKLIPKERYGVKTMSVGYLLPDDKPAVWRGPMVHKLIEQFLADVEWGDLDYLLVDMPPGTGDAQLSLAQLVPLTGAILVTTPQAVATYDVAKAVSMFQQVNTPILGIVENMSGYVIEGMVEGGTPGQKVRLALGNREEELELDPECRFRTVVHMFGQGGAERLAARYGFPMLGQIPLNPAVRVGGDGGDPIVISDPTSLLALRFVEVAGHVAQRIAVRSFSSLPILD